MPGALIFANFHAGKNSRSTGVISVVTPEVNDMLKVLWKKYRISLGDIVDEAVVSFNSKYTSHSVTTATNLYIA
jgi:hypothetical protein